MRDPERIDRILNLVDAIWQRYPDLRLTQLLLNAMPTGMDESQVYNFDDDRLEACLLQHLTDIGG